MIGIGLIGAGMVGQIAHLANFADIPDSRVVAIADLRPELGRQAAKRYGVARLYPSHRELLADPEVDAVVVVTRRPATGPIVLDALNAGKHVLSEKPMAHTVEQATRLVEASRRAGVRYSVGYMKRHDAGVQQAKAMLDALLKSNELGRIILMRAYCFTGDFQSGRKDFTMSAEARPEGLELWPIAPDWLPVELRDRYAWFLNVFVHDINLIRYLAGCTPKVSAVDLRRPNGQLAMLDFGEFPGVLEMGEVPFHEWTEGVEILFEKGRLRVELPPPLLQNVPARVELERSGKAIERPSVPWSWSFRRQAEAFVADIAMNREPLASGADSVEDIRLAEAMWSAQIAQSGQVAGVAR